MCMRGLGRVVVLLILIAAMGIRASCLHNIFIALQRGEGGHFRKRQVINGTYCSNTRRAMKRGQFYSDDVDFFSPHRRFIKSSTNSTKTIDSYIDCFHMEILYQTYF